MPTRLKGELLVLWRERAAHRSAACLGQHLHVIFQTPPLLEPSEHLAQRSNIHVDRAFARALKPALHKVALHDLQPFAVEFDRTLGVRSRLLAWR